MIGAICVQTNLIVIDDYLKLVFILKKVLITAEMSSSHHF